MREDLEQQEQLDAIKGFWSENKKWIVPLVALLLLAAAVFNGWNWWQSRQARLATDALAAMESALAEQNLDKARAAYQALSSDFGGTTQAAVGGLQMGRAFSATGDLAQARAALEQVSKTSTDEFSWIARIRLAAILLDENNAKGALEAISGKPPKELSALVNDRKGDAYAALGNKEEARAAWKLASEELVPQSPTRELVLRKLQTLDSFGDTK